MPVNIDAYNTILKEFFTKNVTLVAVSKTKPNETQIYHRTLLAARRYRPAVWYADVPSHANACLETEEGQQAVKEESAVVWDMG